MPYVASMRLRSSAVSAPSSPKQQCSSAQHRSGSHKNQEPHQNSTLSNYHYLIHIFGLTRTSQGKVLSTV